LKVPAFTPDGNYQMVGLAAYQNDDNYIVLARYFNADVGGAPHFFEFGAEHEGAFSVVSRETAPANGPYFLRLDRTGDDTLTAFISTDGTNWTAISGSVIKPLTSARVAIIVGANLSTTSNPSADLESVEILVLQDPAVLQVTPLSLGFTSTQGAPGATPQTLTVRNTGGGQVNWTATETADWLTLSPASGVATPTNPSSVTASVATAGLAAGTYSTTISVTAANAAGSPQNIPVTLTVVPPAPPTLASASPSFGPTAGGTSVTLAGTGFVSGTTVSFGGTPASSVTIASDTSITAVTPVGVAGTVNVGVSNANGAATLTGGFTYVVPGTTLLAEDFDDGAADGWSNSPFGNGAGWSVANGALTYNGGGHTQLYRGDAGWTDYTLDVAIQLHSLNDWPGGIRGRVNPSTGAGYAVWLYPASGQIVLYRATGWNIDTPGLVVLGSANGIAFDAVNFHRVRLNFQGDQIRVFWDAALVITATDATHASGAIALDVSNQPVTFDDVRVLFGTPPPVPNLTVSPTTLNFAGVQGGSNPQAQTLTVTNSGEGALTWQATTDQSWLAVSPTTGGAPATASVSVAASGLGQGTYTGSVTFTAAGATGSPFTVPVTVVVSAPSAPTLTALSPASGPAGGGTTVTLTGSGFVTGTTVTFGGAPASGVTIISSTSMTAMTPARPAGAVNVVVSNPNGTATLAGGFTYLAPGTTLLADDFNDNNADGWLISPLGNAAGWTVTNGVLNYNGGGHTQLYGGDSGWTDYTFEVSVRLTSLNNWPGGIRGRVNVSTGASYAVWLYPANGQIALYRATGWNIDSPGLALLGSAGGVPFTVGTFNRVRLTFEGSMIRVHWNGALLITATDTAYTSGAVALDVSNQPIAFDNVTVLFGTPPILTAVAPTSGPDTGGTTVTLTGSGFTGGATVTFGGTPASSVTVNSDTSLTAVTPAHAAGAVDVTVVTSNGTATVTGGFTYVVPGTTLLSDDFNDGTADDWLSSPLGNSAGWSVVNGALVYNGGGHTQLYRGDAEWGDYAFEVGVRLASLDNWPGGIRGRVNVSTGASYAVWLYPASGQIVLYRATAWNIDTPGLTVLGSASGIAFDATSLHRLRLTMRGSQLEVHWDGSLVVSTTDTTLGSGVIALDVANQPIAFDDAVVTFTP
jgi:hypothetical protein